MITPATMASPTLFSLSNKSLKLSSPEDLADHIKPLTADPAPSITEIRLNGNTIGVPAAEHLSTLLGKLKSLEVANLADIFTARLLSEIPPALSALLTSLLKCPKLHTVDLSDNAFGLNTVEPLVDFLSKHVPLRHLILNNNGLGPRAGVLVAEALTTLAQKKAEARKAGEDVPELETIVCGRNRLEAGSMPAWAKAFTTLGKVKTVRMVQNGIRQEGIVTLLVEGLVNCQELETLDLQDNTFTATGGKALASVVGKWEKLQELGVGDCLVSARGAGYVVTTFMEGKNKQLKTLRAQYNEVDANVVFSLVTAVESGALPGLRRVEMNGNKFGEDDEKILRLREILDERREAAGAEEEDEGWGVDDLSDMEDDSEEEDGDEDKEEEAIEKKAERVLKDADQEEAENVAQEKDVDALADSLGKTQI